MVRSPDWLEEVVTDAGTIGMSDDVSALPPAPIVDAEWDEPLDLAVEIEDCTLEEAGYGYGV